jgi:molybdopterin molybdotransferase
VKDVDAAQAEIAASFAPIGQERVPLMSALGGFLAAELSVRHDAPPFDNSAMDGYALLAAHVSGASADAPAELDVRGESRAGGPTPPALVERSAMRIFTGAPLPAGADAVVLQEDTQRLGERVHIGEAIASGANVRKRGSDARAGERLLPRHAHIGAGEIAVLASQDFASVPIFRRPRVAILSTGDELRDIGEPARAGSIVNSNAYGLAAQVVEAGAEPWVLPSVPDDLEQVRAAIRAGLAADVLVISGGVSVGEYDVVRDALASEGVALSFWKIRMKPGKPVAFARAGKVPVLGLPGNPVSAWVTFELFVRPGLRKMLGDPEPWRPRVRAVLAAPIARNPGRTEFARARLSIDERGLIAELAKKQGSGSLPSLVAAAALVVIPADAAELAAGTQVEALLLGSYPTLPART